MIEVNIGMKRNEWAKVLKTALVNAENLDNFEFTIYGKSNTSNEDITIKFDNDDMERDEITDECYVEISD